MIVVIANPSLSIIGIVVVVTVMCGAGTTPGREPKSFIVIVIVTKCPHGSSITRQGAFVGVPNSKICTKDIISTFEAAHEHVQDFKFAGGGELSPLRTTVIQVLVILSIGVMDAFIALPANNLSFGRIVEGTQGALANNCPVVQTLADKLLLYGGIHRTFFLTWDIKLFIQKVNFGSFAIFRALTLDNPAYVPRLLSLLGPR
jgi:hypothetical protein